MRATIIAGSSPLRHPQDASAEFGKVVWTPALSHDADGCCATASQNELEY
jgi:hypothetical protein